MLIHMRIWSRELEHDDGGMADITRISSQVNFVVVYPSMEITSKVLQVMYSDRVCVKTLFGNIKKN